MKKELEQFISGSYVRPEKEFNLSNFFRMLAEENLTIIEGNFKTASADIENRVLRIPHYSTVEKSVRILFGAHEAAHFLFTPKSLLHSFCSPGTPGPLKTCINIIEDVRIEKAIRQKYPGLVREFRKGYSWLLANEFFGEITNETGYIDRFNVMSKAGPSSGLTFTGKDLAVFKYLTSIQSANKVVEYAKFLYAYSKLKDEMNSPEKENKQTTSGEKESQQDGTGESDYSEDSAMSEAGYTDIIEEIKKAAAEMKEEDFYEKLEGSDSEENLENNLSRLVESHQDYIFVVPKKINMQKAKIFN